MERDTEIILTRDTEPSVKSGSVAQSRSDTEDSADVLRTTVTSVENRCGFEVSEQERVCEGIASKQTMSQGDAVKTMSQCNAFNERLSVLTVSQDVTVLDKCLGLTVSPISNALTGQNKAVHENSEKNQISNQCDLTQVPETPITCVAPILACRVEPDESCLPAIASLPGEVRELSKLNTAVTSPSVDSTLKQNGSVLLGDVPVKSLTSIFSSRSVNSTLKQSKQNGPLRPLDSPAKAPASTIPSQSIHTIKQAKQNGSVIPVDVPAKATVLFQPVDAVDGPPVFAERPGDVTVNEGEPAFFQCCVSAKHQPLVMWYRDTELLRSGAVYRQVYDGKVAQLGIREVFGADTGVYECVARNTHGKVSATCRLSLSSQGWSSLFSFFFESRDAETSFCFLLRHIMTCMYYLSNAFKTMCSDAGLMPADHVKLATVPDRRLREAGVETFSLSLLSYLVIS